MKPIQRTLILAGSFVPIVFWTTLALSAGVLGGYSHLSNMVSELGAAGTETRALFASGLLVCSVLSVVFVVGLFQECRKAGLNTLPVLLVLTYSFSIAGAAIYPMPHRLHGILGSSSVLLLLSPILAAVLWRPSAPLKGLLPVSLLSLFVMTLGFLVFFPNVLSEFFGLKQRFFHAGWSVWFVYLSVRFLGIHERSDIVRVDSSAESVGSGSA